MRINKEGKILLMAFGLMVAGLLLGGWTSGFQSIARLKVGDSTFTQAIDYGHETITEAGALSIFGASSLDGTDAGGAGAAITLAAGTHIGEVKTIVCTEATTTFTLTIAAHAEGDGKEVLFDAVDESLTLTWTGTEWETVHSGAITGVSIDNCIIGATTPAAASVTTLNSHDEVRVIALQFYDVDVAESQTAAGWGTDPAADVGGANFKEIPIAFAGSVIGVSVFSNDACTSGTFAADVTINGAATGLQANLDSITSTTVDSSTQANDADTFTVNQRIGVDVTTSADWLTTTSDIVVMVYVEY